MGNTHLMASIDELGIADVLVVTLKHTSPYCVAAAAAVMHDIARSAGGGLALIKASGAVPALVRVIGAGRPPATPDIRTGLSQKCVVGYIPDPLPDT